MIYLGDFDDQEDVESKFNVKLEPHTKILIAVYTRGGYDGSAWVLVVDERTLKLYEVNGSHCSCYGLEDQWDLEETSKASLLKRMEDGNVGPYEYNINEDLHKVLQQIV